METLKTLLSKVRDCQACAHVLPLGPRPILQVAVTARILIASQAPGTKAHHSGVPFRDASGNRLREWLEVSTDEFYDTRNFAIIPIGLCYPGRLPNGGDAPPRPECAPLWRKKLLAHLPDVRLTLLVGAHSQAAALGRGLMTSRVRGFRDHLPAIFPLPHPSWRTKHWAEGNPWFDTDVLPSLRAAVRCALT